MLGGEWGGIVVTCFVLAFAMMGVGDSGLRPALRRVNPPPDRTLPPATKHHVPRTRQMAHRGIPVAGRVAGHRLLVVWSCVR